MGVRDVGELLAAINNDCYLVRHYHSQRTSIERLRRHQAIQKLGETLKFAFSQTDQYEALIAALLDGLRPEDRPPF